MLFRPLSKLPFGRLNFATVLKSQMEAFGFHTSEPSASKSGFRNLLSQASNVMFLTGAGVSAESGIPTFRGAGGYWRTYKATDLATLAAFGRNPSLVWEFYSYRREVVFSKKPNPAHFAIAEFQKRYKELGKKTWIITQNIDGLHQAAGAEDVIELHGTLFKTRCLKCGHVEENRNSPIVPALLNKGAPDSDAKDAAIPESELPRCSQPGCDSLVRPHVVWFGETLFDDVLSKTHAAMDACDFCIIVGTSSVVYPAAGFAPQLAARGVPVAEFNMESTPCTGNFSFHFQGKAGETLPPLLEVENQDS